MNTYLLAAMISLLIIFIAVTFWNAKALSDLKKLTLSNAGSIADAKYFELKFNIQLLIGIFTVLVTLCTTVVYSSISSAKDEINEQLKVAADSAKNRIEKIEPQLREAESTIAKSKVLVSQLNSIQTSIKNINSKNILKQSYYTVSGIKFTVSGPEDTRTIKFKDLKTNSGDLLPAFERPPIIVPAPDELIPVMVYDVTTTSFSVAPYMVQIGTRNPFDGKPIEFSILVLEK